MCGYLVDWQTESAVRKEKEAAIARFLFSGIPPWLPWPPNGETGETIQLKTISPARGEVYHPCAEAEYWINKASVAFELAPGVRESRPIVGWRPMTKELWALSPDVPEAAVMAWKEQQEARRRRPEARLAWLEECRRWRPMSEHPPALLPVMVRSDGVFRARVAQRLAGGWHWTEAALIQDDLSETENARREWCYIPGSEPIEAER